MRVGLVGALILVGPRNGGRGPAGNGAGAGGRLHRRLRRSRAEAAYRLDEAAYGHSVTRRQGWYDGERDRRTLSLPGFRIARTPVTNAQYAAFVAETGHRAPDVDAETWKGYGLIHPYPRTRRHAWAGGRVPEGRAQHPVVLVSHKDARAYTAWLSARTGRAWRLPTELEWRRRRAARTGAGSPGAATMRPGASTAMTAGRSTPCPSAGSPRAHRRSACWTPPPGLRVDRDRGPGRAFPGQGRVLGRQRLRRLPSGRPPQPPGRAEAHPDRLPPGNGRTRPAQRPLNGRGGRFSLKASAASWKSSVR